jgi:hypothetical protein
VSLYYARLSKDARGGLRFLVDPGWRVLVQAEDVEYLESLLGDFLERAKGQIATLFKQLSSLEAGPLVTREIGEQISDHPPLIGFEFSVCAALARLCSTFP